MGLGFGGLGHRTAATAVQGPCGSVHCDPQILHLAALCREVLARAVHLTAALCQKSRRPAPPHPPPRFPTHRLRLGEAISRMHLLVRMLLVPLVHQAALLSTSASKRALQLSPCSPRCAPRPRIRRTLGLCLRLSAHLLVDSAQKLGS